MLRNQHTRSNYMRYLEDDDYKKFKPKSAFSLQYIIQKFKQEHI